MDAVERGLVDAIVRDPEDPVAYRVYADYLIARGDRRVELAIQAAAADDDRSGDVRLAAAVAEHTKLVHRELGHARLTWRHGFIATARMSERSDIEDLERLLRHEAARFLTELTIEVDPRSSSGEVLGRAAPGTLRELHVGRRYGRVGPLNDVWRRVPELRELTLVGELLEVGRVELPAVRSVLVALDGIRRERVAEELAHARWPQLEQLCLREVPSRALLEVVRRAPETLVDLTLEHCAFTGELVEVLARSPLAARLRRLSLAWGDLDDRAAAPLTRGAFPELELLDVSETWVTSEGAAALAAAFPSVRAHGRRTGAPPRL